jgi:hypothetical protein
MHHFIDKSIEWLVVVGILTLWFITRATEMRWYERIMFGLLPAGLAFGLSDALSEYTGTHDVLMAILIMIFGPGIIGAAMTMGKDEDWISNLVKQYVMKRFDLTDKDEDDS